MGHTETGSILMTGGLSVETGPQPGYGHPPGAVGLCSAQEHPRAMEIGPLLLGKSGETELRLAGYPLAEQRHDAIISLCEHEEWDGKDGKWGESGRRTLPNTNTADANQIASDGCGSNSNLQRAGPVQNDRVEGACSLQFSLVVALVC